MHMFGSDGGTTGRLKACNTVAQGKQSAALGCEGRTGPEPGESED